MQSSSNIAGASYDDERKVLTITFTSGGEYEYLNCPRETYEGLEAAPSPGSFFARNIRNVYQTVKVG